MRSALDYELSELPQGPKIGQRHKVVNIQHLELFEADERRLKEVEVREVVAHSRKKTKVQYLVRWEDGDLSWEPTRNLVDKEGKGYVIAEALIEYWRKDSQKKIRCWRNGSRCIRAM
ncbi:MAG: chromo domain-containing protein [Thaumarchaeota archaeon]|nr:chromo domain-containing protein [Nitrososphaerota archaeon]